MKRRIMALLMCVVMVLVFVMGCNKKTPTSTDPTKAPEKTEDATKAPEKTEAPKKEAEKTEAPTEAPKETAVPENVVTGDADAADAFFIYGWNTDVQNSVVKAFTEKYPEDAKRLVFVNTGGSDCYQTKIDPLLEDPNNKFYPDMFAMEFDYMMKYTDSDYTLDVEELGLTQKDFDNMYQYTVQAATVDGVVKGLSWQACPGCMVYRRSLADKYLGVSEPKDVQAFFKDWDTTMATSKKIKEASGGKTRLYSGYTELQRPYQAQRKEAWLDSDSKLVVDATMLEYMKSAKTFVDEGYASSASADQQWGDNWAALKGNDAVFAYTSCTWFNQYCLLGNVPDSTVGDWAMIQGPTEFYWGGTWLGVGSNCSDKDMAAKVLSVLCDVDAMKSIYKNTNDYPNNKETIKQLAAANETNDVVKLLGGQNFLEFFMPIAEKITLPAMCGEDFYINNFFNDQVGRYVTGEKDYDTAVADFKKTVVDYYTYVTAD